MLGFLVLFLSAVVTFSCVTVVSLSFTVLFFFPQAVIPKAAVSTAIVITVVLNMFFLIGLFSNININIHICIVILFVHIAHYDNIILSVINLVNKPNLIFCLG